MLPVSRSTGSYGRRREPAVTKLANTRIFSWRDYLPIIGIDLVSQYID